MVAQLHRSVNKKRKEGFPGMATRASVESLGWGGLGPRGEYSESGPTQLRFVPFCPGGTAGAITSLRNDPSWANPFLARVSFFVRQV